MLNIDVAGILFVDDTDLLHIDISSHNSSANEVHWEMEASIHNWGNLLLATGGELKPKKCSYPLIAYGGQAQCGWTYYDCSTDDGYQMTVPTEDGV